MTISKGAVVIDTKLNYSKIEKDFKKLDVKTKNLISQYNKTVDSIRSQELALTRVKNKMEEIVNGNKVPTSLKNMEKKLKDCNKEISNLENEYSQCIKDIETKQVDIDFAKGLGNNEDLSKLEAEMQVLDNKSIQYADSLENARDKADRLVSSVQKLKNNPMSTDEYRDLQNQITVAQGKLDTTKDKANNLKNGIRDAFNQKAAILNFSKNTNDLKNNFDGIGKKIDAFKNKMTRLVSTVAIFSLLRNGLTKLRDGFFSLLNANDGFSKSLNQIKANLMTAFAPIYNACLPAINTLMNALIKITGTIATFVSSLFGISTKKASKMAQDLSKSLKKTKKSADDTAGSLASFDKLEVIKKPSSSGNDDKGIDYSGQVESSSKLMAIINKIKDILATLFEPFKRAWNTKGQAVIESIKNAFNGIASLGKSVFESIMDVWTNGTGQTIIENILQMWTNIFNIVGEIAKALSNAWDNNGNGTAIIQAIADIFIIIQKVVNSITGSLLNWTMSDDFQTALNIVVEILRDIIEFIKKIVSWCAEMYEKYIAPVVDKILKLISKIIIAIGKIWEFIKPLVDLIVDIILTVLEPVIASFWHKIETIIDILNSILDFIINVFSGNWNKIWDDISNVASNAWDKIKEVWNAVVDWFNKNIIEPVKNLFSEMWNVLKNGASNAWNGIKSVFSNVANFFRETFQNAWQKVKDVFSIGGKIFDGIKDGIVNSFKTIVNAIIGGINKVVKVPFDGINTALTKIKNIDIFGNKPFKGLIHTISVPRIPKLATGAVIPPNSEFLAVLGDQKRGTNIEAPLDTIKQALREVQQENEGNSSGTLNLNIIAQFGTDRIGNVVLKGIRLKEKELGKPLLVN